jgi:hypothetical protein
MAITVALEALGHDALTMEKFTVFELIVVEEALLIKGICLIWCPNVNQQWLMQSAGF